MAIEEGKTEIPDSEDEPFTSSPLEAWDAANKLPPAHHDETRAPHDAAQDAGCVYETSCEDVSAAAASESVQILGVGRGDASRETAAIRGFDPANEQLHNPIQQYDVQSEVNSAQAKLLSEEKTSVRSGNMEQLDKTEPSEKQALALVEASLPVTEDSNRETNIPSDRHGERPIVQANPHVSVIEKSEIEPKDSMMNDYTASSQQDSDNQCHYKVPNKEGAHSKAAITDAAEPHQVSSDVNVPAMVEADMTARQHETQNQESKANLVDKMSVHDSLEAGPTTIIPKDACKSPIAQNPQQNEDRATVHDQAPQPDSKDKEKESMDTSPINHNDKPETLLVQNYSNLPEKLGSDLATPNVRDAETGEAQSDMPNIVETSNASTKLPRRISGSKPSTPAKTSQEAALADLKAQRAALLASLTALPYIQDVITEDQSSASSQVSDSEPTDAEVMAAAQKIVKKHIKLLHEYNEIKDIGQGLMGLIADQRGVRIVEVQDEFGIGPKD